ncbi:MAG: hypothetical protein KF810_16835 [Rhizobiaceae bacterium]|nr:hypothetical protein [Rhizobiaceae bacterium]
MGFLSDMFGGASKKAAKANMAMLSGLKTEGMNYIDQGQQQSQGYLNEAKGLYGDLTGTSQGNLGYYKDALGLNGAQGSADALSRFQAGPGYDFTMSQGLDALNRTAAARGQLNSGNTNIDTLRYATGLADNTWQSYLNNLQGYDQQQNNNMLTGIAGQAGALGGLSNLTQGGVDQRLNLASEIVNGQMGANNQLAQARNQGASAGLSLLGLGLGYL